MYLSINQSNLSINPSINLSFLYCLITDIVLPEDLQLVGGVLLQLGTIDHLQMQLCTGEGEMVDGVGRDCSCNVVMGDDSDYDSDGRCNYSDGYEDNR